MQWQMIGPAEWSGAQFAAERFDARVFTEMSCQFIGPRKTPFTSVPCAYVRFFAYKREMKITKKKNKNENKQTGSEKKERK